MLLERAEREIASLKFQLRRATRDLAVMAGSAPAPIGRPATAPAHIRALDPADAAANGELLPPQLAQPEEGAPALPSRLWLCPITRTTLVDPVIAMDGTTYEREAIFTHFARFGLTSPATGEALASDLLIENITVRRALAFLETPHARAQGALAAGGDAGESLSPTSCLPLELLLYIFSFLEGSELARCAMVCRYWRTVVADDFIWEQCLANEFPGEVAPNPFTALKDGPAPVVSRRVQYRELFRRQCALRGAGFPLPQRLPGVKLFSNMRRRLPTTPRK